MNDQLRTSNQVTFPDTAERLGISQLVSGFWGNADWIWCRDEKYRPIEPESSPLATGVTNRVGKLRGYGNAITAEVAKGFIESYLEVERLGKPVVSDFDYSLPWFRGLVGLTEGDLSDLDA